MSEALLAVARRERWVVSRAELRAAGLASSLIGRRVDEGWLVPVFRGVYLVGRSRPTRDERERAALKGAGRGAVLARRSAAARHGLLRWDGPVEVWAPTQRRSQPGLRVVRGALEGRDVTTRDGVPLTTVAATLVALAGVLDEAALDRAVHEAEVRGVLWVPAVDHALARAGRVAGVPRLRRVLADRRPVDGRLDSRLEHRVHRFFAAYGFPPSEHNVTFELDDGERVSVDVLFRGAWVALEVDGDPHRSTRAFAADRRRDRRLWAVHRLRVVRVCGADLERPDELAADLRAALRGLA